MDSPHPVFELLGICIKDRNWMVLSQNSKCKMLCGDKVNQICRGNCHLFNKESAVHSSVSKLAMDRSAKIYDFDIMNGRLADLVVIQMDQFILSLLCPVEDRVQELLVRSQEWGLSPRESEIFLLKLRGKSNREICEQMFISESTLKTHINHICQKGQITAR